MFVGRVNRGTRSLGVSWRRGPGFWGVCKNLGRARTVSLYLHRGQLVPGGRGSQVSLALPEGRKEKTPPKQCKQNQARFPWPELGLLRERLLL